MDLGNAIALSATAIELLEARDYDRLVEELNRPQIGVANQRGGLVTMAEMSDVVGVELTAGFNFTIQNIVEQLKASPEQSDQAQALYLFDFRERFSKSDLGVDMSNEVLRATLAGLLQMAQWSQEQIDAVLSLGKQFLSPMQYQFQRDATRADVDRYLTLRTYDEAWLNNVQRAYNEGDKQGLIDGLKVVIEALERGE